ncbi:MAG: aldo/keto reductase [Coriobacteriia bacterium]
MLDTYAHGKDVLRGITSTIDLANGVRMPRLGLGTYRSARGGEVEAAVKAALDLGYRSIDTASLYGNEEGIGRAVAESGLPREEVFVTSKVGNSEQGYDSALQALARSLRRLRTGYLDLYLIHWPQPRTPESWQMTLGTWRAMEHAYAEGSVRAIGVCNFLESHLERLAQASETRPMVNQYEFHPWLQQPELGGYCDAHGIVAEAWAPVMKGRVDEVPELVLVAETHRKSPAQVAIRWILQHGMVTIPKSVHRERLAENADVFDFELSDEEMAMIDLLDRGARLGPHPDRGGAR